MTQVAETAVPVESLLQPSLASADFYDAYAAPLQEAGLTPTEIFLRVSRATPRWIAQLMALRNRLVRLVGLKDVGAMGGATGKLAADYRVGDRLGIFSIFETTDKELVLGIDDHHLDVRVSVLKAPAESARSYVVSTVVHIHNRLGRLYMAPVGFIHPFIVRAMMARAPL
ncbi:MAG TPA: DUF2867 domain-containing protein [Methylocella sp.]|nr:DUF2867 domain-containing protein [Methylocella sp.]